MKSGNEFHSAIVLAAKEFWNWSEARPGILSVCFVVGPLLWQIYHTEPNTVLIPTSRVSVNCVFCVDLGRASSRYVAIRYPDGSLRHADNSFCGGVCLGSGRTHRRFKQVAGSDHWWNRWRPKSLITEKNLPKSPNQNHKCCVTKSPNNWNKRQQKSRNVAGVNQALSLELYSL